MTRNIQSITTEFLDTKHNPSELRNLAQLEIDISENDEDLDNIVATEDVLQKSAKEAAQDSSGPGKKKSEKPRKNKSSGMEPVASGGGCCIIL